MNKSTTNPILRPQITFIVPSYNAEKTIQATISSILDQQCIPSFEVIVIDNLSQDRTRDYAKKFPIHLHVQPQPGAAATRNLGLQMAQGTYIALVDADVELDPYWASQGLKAFEQPGVTVVQGANQPAGEDGTMLTYRQKTIAQKTQQTFNYLYTAKSHFPQINTAAVMLRTDLPCWRPCSFRTQLGRCEDTDLTLQLFFAGAHFLAQPTMKSRVYDHRTPLAYLKRSYLTGLASAQLAKEWGLNLAMQASCWGSDTDPQQQCFSLLNRWAFQWGATQNTLRFPRPLKPLTRTYYRPAFEQGLLYSITLAGKTIMLSPDVRIVWLEDEVILYSIGRLSKEILNGQNFLLFKQAFTSQTSQASIAQIQRLKNLGYFV